MNPDSLLVMILRIFPEENFFFICILVGMPKLFGISFWVYVK